MLYEVRVILVQSLLLNKMLWLNVLGCCATVLLFVTGFVSIIIKTIAKNEPNKSIIGSNALPISSTEFSRTLCSDILESDTPEYRACLNAKMTQPDLSGPLELIYFYNISTVENVMEEDAVYTLPWDDLTTCNLLALFHNAAGIASSAGIVISRNLTITDDYDAHPGKCDICLKLYLS